MLLMLVACRSDTIHINVNFSHLSGLAKGDRVLFQGNPAGTVATIAYQPEGTYRVGLAVDNGYAHALTEHSRFYVSDDPTRKGSKAVIIHLARSGGEPLKDGASVTGGGPPDDIFAHWKRELEDGLNYLQEQVEKFSRDVQGIPESEAYRNLRRSLQEWAQEMEQATEKTRDKIEREWLPRIQKELEELREQLKPSGREETLEPLEREVQRIRNI